jgi:hypothetical protein
LHRTLPAAQRRRPRLFSSYGNSRRCLLEHTPSSLRNIPNAARTIPNRSSKISHNHNYNQTNPKNQPKTQTQPKTQPGKNKCTQKTHNNNQTRNRTKNQNTTKQLAPQQPATPTQNKKNKKSEQNALEAYAQITRTKMIELTAKLSLEAAEISQSTSRDMANSIVLATARYHATPKL